SLQLPLKSILRRPGQPVNRPSKRVCFTEPPRRVVLTSYATDAHGLLREILTEKHGPAADKLDKLYKLETRVLLPLSNNNKPEDGYRIPVIEPSRRNGGQHTRLRAFPGVKGHRF